MERTVQSTKQWTESKAVRKARKAREKAGLSYPQTNASNKNYVVCLKWGTKYGPEYVNKLYNMVSKHLTIEHEFICFTDNKSGIDKHIRTEPLPNIPVEGWWYKPFFVGGELPIQGTILFFDLDVIIFKNIDQLFSHAPGKFCIIRDFNRSIRPKWDKVNSSVFRVNTGQYQSQWQTFKENPRLHTARNRGDQDWMYKNIKDHEFWPDQWIMSYKWEMRDRNDLKLKNGKRNFIVDKPPEIKPQTCIAVFHGDPNPADANDSWVRKHWA